jgi:hypothetical protein
MPKRTRRRAFLPEVVERLGPIPLAPLGTSPHGAFIELRNAFCAEMPLSPPQVVSAQKLVYAGYFAFGFGGKAAASPTDGQPLRGHPASLELAEVVQRFEAAISKSAELEDDDGPKLLALLDAGFEAYGFISARGRRPGRPPRRAAAEELRYYLARRSRNFESLNLETALTRCAKGFVLRENRRQAVEQERLLPTVLSIEDEHQVATVRERMRKAHERSPPMTAEEIAVRRRVTACALRRIRSDPALRKEFCPETW